ncbi:MAG: hypothetical protein N2485_03460 [bacterium]|nr:hypothetical protein [bacterium]
MKEEIFTKENQIDILELVDKILELYKRNNLEELEIKIKDFELKISSKEDINIDSLKLFNSKLLNEQLLNQTDLLKSNLISNEKFSEVEEFNDLKQENNLKVEDDIAKYSKIIRAPLSGNFYINVGGNELISLNKNIQKGDVVCVIEAMKVMNEVNSEYEGIVKKIIPKNGDFVKEGDPIIVLE